ncbi:metal-sensitive transcriptional regulator [Candidatus Peribacteria bacterium]|nr:metal-sensitive transcriptional regulator [Candidatus Peribacteria bacterium]
MKDPHKSKVLTNLKKTRGLLDTIESMVQEGRYCMDIAQQMNAALGYLRSANTTILR